MVGWHHQLNGHEFEQAPANSEGQGSLGCCSPWGGKESDTTERLNNSTFRLQVMAKILCKLRLKGIWHLPMHGKMQKASPLPIFTDTFSKNGSYLLFFFGHAACGILVP